MQLREIHFNHDPGGATSDAFTLGRCPAFVRPGEPLTITAPEWKDGIAKPVAYARNLVTDPVTIKASFSRGPAGERVKIRAVGPVGDRLRVNGPARQTTFLGDVQSKFVVFDHEGNSGLQTFDLKSRIGKAPVGVTDVTWTWQYYHGGRAWHDFATTTTKVFVTIWLPVTPWKQAVAVAPDLLPWFEAIQLACQWAAGATTNDDVIRNIATAINGLPTLVYDEAGTQFVDTKKEEFLLTLFLSQLYWASSVTIDCRGIASALMTFAGLLGVDLRPLVIENDLGGYMTTFDVKALSSPEWMPEKWTWHEVAVDPASPVLDNMGGVMPGVTIAADQPLVDVMGRELIVYDANLHLNHDAPIFPIKVRLGTAGSGDQRYRDLLIQKGSGNRATPKNPRVAV